MVHAAVAEREVDLQDAEAGDRSERVLSMFDSLFPGERFVLIAGDSCAGILGRLQLERSGSFEWSPLSSGPPVWRIELTRREAPSRGSRRRISEALGWDHDRLDALEETAFRLRDAGDLAAAFDLFAQFARGLTRHIAIEEEVVFPIFEDRADLPRSAGPTAVMREEHRRIRQRLDEIDGAIGDAAGEVERSRGELRDLLESHNLKEERVLYPAVDALLSDEEADAVVREFQRYGG